MSEFVRISHLVEYVPIAVRSDWLIHPVSKIVQY